MYKCKSISRYILNEVETCHHLISIRLYFILTILITEDDYKPYFFLTIATRLVFFHKLLYYIKYMYSFIPMSGCVGMGPSALLFPGARDAVKTALLLLLLSKKP
jgi:hypothetical protein